MTATPATGPVLVTGATGFVAGHCIRELLEHGYPVRGTVRSLAATDKTAHLHALADQFGGSLDLVEADLSAATGWDAAVAGCTAVLHVASPLPPEVPKDADELVRPAVDGTLHVLRASAASSSVRRVVLTSSVAAVSYGHAPDTDSVRRTEADWSNPDGCQPYEKSKTLAEQAAWRFVGELPADQRFELTTVNPGLVLGPLLRAERPTSLEVVRKLLSREVPAAPRLGFAAVDVRDVATAHRLAMEAAAAPGNRYICAGEHIWMRDVGRILAGEFNRTGRRVPTGQLPNWLVRILARFDKAVRLAASQLDRQELVSSAKATAELGWTMRPIEQTIIDAGHSLIEHGVVKPAKGDKGDAKRATTAA